MNWIYAWSDPADSWLSDDKLAHFFGAFTAYCLFHSFRVVVLAILLVEVVELYRYHLWMAKGRPRPQPWMCDKVSLKDIMCGLGGLIVALLA